MAYELKFDEKNRPIFPTQHPEADYEYSVSFREWLAQYADGDTIQQATVTSERGMTYYSVGWDDYTVTFWAKLGKSENEYIVRILAETVNGRKLPYEVVIPFGFEQVRAESYQ